MMRDPISFIEGTLINFETGKPFELTEAECSFLEHAFELRPDGRLMYPELIFSGPKKSGKTAFAAMVLLYMVRVLGGRFAEGVCVANSQEQAQGRVFQSAARIVEASPLLNGDAKVFADEIKFESTGGLITAIPSDAGTAAGANPSISVFDELWGYRSERAHRLFDELIPPPTRKIACRLTVTYAGYEGESELLESLYKRGLAGEEIAPDLYAQPGMLMYWTHEFSAPWQTEEWREDMRQQLRPNAYLRLIENQWVSTEGEFIALDQWDECVDVAARPVIADKRLPVIVGVDASFKHDNTAIVGATYDRAERAVRLVAHRVFQPSPDDPLDFERTIEATIFELMDRFDVREVRYDPWQMQAVAQRLVAARVPMREFPQTPANLTEATQNLYDLVKGRNLILYPDADMRLALSRCVATESGRGWKISKSKQSHKIDVIVALAQAALGAVELVSKAQAFRPTPADVLRARTERPGQYMPPRPQGASTSHWARLAEQARVLGPARSIPPAGMFRPATPPANPGSDPLCAPVFWIGGKGK